MPANLPEVTAEGQVAAANAFAGLGLWERQRLPLHEMGIQTVGTACGLGVLAVAFALVLRSRLGRDEILLQSSSESVE